MLTNSDAVSKLMTASSVEDVAETLSLIGIDYFFWQHRGSETMKTWDHMPEGFLQTYYGLRADVHCPAAWAMRQNKWRMFSLEFSKTACSNEFKSDAVVIWNRFGFDDGVIVMSGDDSFTCFVCEQGERMKAAYAETLMLASMKFDQLIQGRDDLCHTMPREIINLSPREEMILRMQLDYPELSYENQAKKAGISVKTLKDYHQKIAKKFGVTSFTGATVLAINDNRLQMVRH